MRRAFQASSPKLFSPAFVPGFFLPGTDKDAPGFFLPGTNVRSAAAATRNPA
jgi:hypothetical protein